MRHNPTLKTLRGRSAPARPDEPAGSVSVEILDEQSLPLMIMPVAQAVKRGLCFRKAVTALYAEDRIFLRKTALLPAGRREALDLFSTPVPADLSPEDAAGVGLGDALGWEPAVRFVAELPPGPGAPERLHLFRCVLPKGAAALPAGRGLSPFDADELSGIATQSPELFSQDLLRALAAGLLFP